jgi:hypothetical protein
VTHAFTALFAFAALTVVGSVATLLVHGGWEAVAAGLAVFAGVGFAVTFAVIGASGERSRPGTV